jgi:uncharacterized metal-binding protein
MVTECDATDGWHSYVQCDTHGNCDSATYQKASGANYREEPINVHEAKAAKRRSDDQAHQALVDLCSSATWKVIGVDRCLSVLPVTSRPLTPILSAQDIAILQPTNLPRKLPNPTRHH